MNINNIHSVYFVGIGGIGMSAIARYFKSLGKHVGGYDKTSTDITESLVNLGVQIHYEDDTDAIPAVFKNKATTLIVYTPAVPDSHAELNYFFREDFLVLKRAEVLGLITRNTICFAVAGTHGKTTTSSILGHLLKKCNAKMTAFLGGITENYESNLIMNGSEISVVEADEFDRSFLQLSPDYACVTSMDADHLDIYEDSNALVESFKVFAGKISNKQKMFVRKGLELEGVTYGLEDGADFQVKNISIEKGAYHFSISTPTEQLDNVVFNLPGVHNISNALVAFAMAYDAGFDKYDLIDGLGSFLGVKRRFSYKLKTEELVFIDDYAHHPTEINAVHQAISELYPNEKTCLIFQPHLFSRTKDFAEDFAQSLSKFDEVYLLDIYPARELPIKGISSEWLLSKIQAFKKGKIQKSEMINVFAESNAKVLLTLGAGDIGAEVDKIKRGLTIEN